MEDNLEPVEHQMEHIVSQPPRYPEVWYGPGPVGWEFPWENVRVSYARIRPPLTPGVPPFK